jgi:large subunit ribosomal protein L6
MSRIAKIPIFVPPGLEVSLGTGQIRVKGPKGELAMRVHPMVEIGHENGEVTCKARDGATGSLAQVGTARSLIANMVLGVDEGFGKELQLVGIGYRAQMQDGTLVLSLGFSHQIEHRCPKDISIETPSPTRIVVRGIDKQRVGQTAAEIRAYRPPEPYKGKGVRYVGEIVARKEAKKKQK